MSDRPPEQVIRGFIEASGYEVAGSGEQRGIYPIPTAPVLAALAALLAEKERYEEALSFYADHKVWTDHEDSIYEQPEPWAAAKIALVGDAATEGQTPDAS